MLRHFFYLVMQVCQERREREDLKEMVSEDKEAYLDHQVTQLIFFFFFLNDKVNSSSNFYHNKLKNCINVALNVVLQQLETPCLSPTVQSYPHTKTDFTFSWNFLEHSTPMSPIKNDTFQPEALIYLQYLCLRHLHLGSCTT